MAQSQTEVIVYDADGEYRVFPPVIRLNAANGGANAEKLTVSNATDEDLAFYAGSDVIDNSGNPTLDIVKAGKSFTTKAVKSNGNGNTKVFSYQLVAPKSGKKAKGNSDPKIIVEN